MSEVASNWLFILLAISASINFVKFAEWFDKRQVEKQIEQNKRRGNHFKEEVR
ncbi:hypothetical protein ACQW5G_01305 [Fructilactobacillus sp. Tb1]|uniref:hypothetical protein n=1 Tax=Fructilactobacillus sp. Tb1 TaxID=3422304 RepID=UPI003D269B87